MITSNEIARVNYIMSSFEREWSREEIVKTREGNGIGTQTMFGKIRFSIRVEENLFAENRYIIGADSVFVSLRPPPWYIIFLFYVFQMPVEERTQVLTGVDRI